MKRYTGKTFIRLMITSGVFGGIAFSCAAKHRVSGLDTVGIDQTEVRDQYRVGFCWAYAAIGLIESKYKMETGKSLDLSEEALGFRRMAESLLSNATAYKAGRMSLDEATNPLVTQNGLEGWYVRGGGPSQPGGMELAEKYGVMPESAWSFKFKTGNDVQRLKAAILSRYSEVLAGSGQITMRDIESVLTAPGAYPSVPPATFVFDGREISSASFVHDVLKFRSADYKRVVARGSGDAPKVVAAAKRALVRGVSVPMSFIADEAYLTNGVYRADAAGALPDKKKGHAVLITDFVNDGGREGAIPEAEIRAELAKGYDSLAFLKFKNSWGVRARTNERGVPVSAGSEGYFYLTRSYLDAIASVPYLEVIVPADIAADPFGEEPINQRVADNR